MARIEDPCLLECEVVQSDKHLPVSSLSTQQEWFFIIWNVYSFFHSEGGGSRLFKNVGKYQTAWRHFPEGISLFRRRRENLKSVTVWSDSSEICDVRGSSTFNTSRH
jgi:hypothetical protein